MSTNTSDQTSPTKVSVSYEASIIAFTQFCDEMKTVHKAKAHDYSGDTDPHDNFNQAVEFGVDPFVGLMLRLNDKVSRVKTFIRKGTLLNESCDDALRDIAVYATIGRVMLLNKGALSGPK